MFRFFALVPLVAASMLSAQDVEPAASPEPDATRAIAVPPLATPRPTETAIGNTARLGNQVAEIIAADLRSTGQFSLSGPDGIAAYPYVEATAPAFPRWRGSGTQALVSGFVEARPDGRIAIGCYLYDVTAGRELARQGYAVSPTDWRRAAHRCADAINAKLSGAGAMFDSRIVYVAETGPRDARVKRLATMDADGSNHRYVTAGQSMALTPRLSPDGRQIVYTSTLGRMPRVFVIDVATGNERMVVPGRVMTFAPRFSPDGRDILFSMAQDGNTDLYVVSAYGGIPRRLTDAPGADTAASYSPDGRQIVFESDRSGGQQIYVMDSDGTNQRRISFGDGRFASPAWSPDGELVAFTRAGGDAGIGVMTPGGSDLRMVTQGLFDEAPAWSPNSRFLLFQRTNPDSGQSGMHMIGLAGGSARPLTLPQDGSDPSWSAPQR